MDNGIFDIVVLGGGIAGLLLASELSHDHTLLLIEQNDTIPNSKYWMTDRNSTKDIPHLLDCIDMHYNSLDFIAFDGTSCRIPGEYVMWNSHCLINKLVTATRTNGGLIWTGLRFYSFRYQTDLIEILANDKKIRSRLVIDCMGHSSPLIYSLGAIRLLGYYILYGGALKLSRKIDPIALANVSIDSRPSYFEVLPTADDIGHTVLIQPAHKTTAPSSLKNEFNFIVRKSRYRMYFDEHDNDWGEYTGIVPVGKQTKYALDRIYFYGEAGQFNPATTSTCLSIMFGNFKKTAANLSFCINNNRLSKNDLRHCGTRIDRFNIRLQQNIYRYLSSANSSDFVRLVQGMNQIDRNALYDFLFGDVRPRSLIKDLNLATIIRKGLLPYFFPLIRSYIGL
jgi:hypothetical protein